MTYKLVGSYTVTVDEEFDDLTDAIERGRELKAANQQASVVVVGDDVQVTLYERTAQAVV